MMDKKFCGSGSFVFPLPLDYSIPYVMHNCNTFYINFLSFLIIFPYYIRFLNIQNYNGFACFAEDKKAPLHERHKVLFLLIVLLVTVFYVLLLFCCLWLLPV